MTSSVSSMLTKKQTAFLGAVPLSTKGIMERAYKATRGTNVVIKAKCLDCSNFQREEIRECRVETCPLWNVRPFRDSVGNAMDADELEEAANALTDEYDF